MSEGKLEKLKITAYSDPDCKTQVGDPFSVLINPETYTQEIKLQINDAQSSGTSAAQPRFVLKPPEELTFDFLFDSSGIIDGFPKADVFDDIEKFREMLMGYHGEIHETKFFEIIWGKKLFRCRCISLTISYKLFNPNGIPIRANCKVVFKQLTEENLRVANEKNKSPDLTHYRTVKKGDTLPLMCYRIYGSSIYYLQVAKVNGLTNFKKLQPGAEIFFPPFEKAKA